MGIRKTFVVLSHSMRRWFGVALLILCLPFFVTGQTITLPAMTETTTFSPSDILWIVINPATTPQSRKIQATNLLKRRHPCEVLFGNPNPNNATVLQDGDDAPATCANVTGATAVITAVACRADNTGTQVYPILTGGSTTSIVTVPFNCGNGTWLPGTMTGACNQTTGANCPTLNSYSIDGSTCSTTPCTVDTNINTAGGLSKYAIVRFTILGQ
jgi:hypothetical protein